MDEPYADDDLDELRRVRQSVHGDALGTSTVHRLKIWPEFFDQVQTGAKPFEVRFDDRGFMTGDVLQLQEWDPDEAAYTGRQCRKRVGYVLALGRFVPGADEYVTMALEPIP